MKFCQKCGCVLEHGKRKWCTTCRKKRKCEYQHNRYYTNLQNGIKPKRFGISVCILCGTEIIKTSKTQLLCKDCFVNQHRKSLENYSRDCPRDKTGKTTGRQTILNLGFKIKNLCVHHIDENPFNNNISNLMILNRSHHAKLHRILEKEWSLLLKDNNSNLENCWNILRDQLTTTYLETNSVNVIKITDIGQSAAEPLNVDNIYIFDTHEEGSETMYQTSKSNVITSRHDEDIVQTQN